ncbi:MAG: Repressor CsoR of the copZA operon, partial [uncultured Corynebacteriales bacterium]
GQHGSRHPRVLGHQGRAAQAAAADRGAGPGTAAPGGERHLLHRRADPGVGGHQGAGGVRAVPAGRAPQALRRRGAAERGRGGRREDRRGLGRHRPPRPVL